MRTMAIEQQIPAKWLIISSYVLPVMVLVGAILLSIMPVHVGGYDKILPPFIYSVIYYWAVFRPKVFPASLAFGTGIVMDLLVGLTVGVNAFVLVSMRWIIVVQSRFLSGQQFLAQWLVYGIMTLLGQFSLWALYSLLSQAFIPLIPVVIGCVFSIALFPLFYGILHNVHRLIEIAHETP